MAGDTKVSNVAKTKYLWRLLEEQIASGLSGNRKQKYNISDSEVLRSMRDAAQEIDLEGMPKHGFQYQLGKTTLKQAQSALESGLSPNDGTYFIKTGGTGHGRTLEEVRRDATEDAWKRYEAGEITERQLRVLSSNRTQKEIRVAAEKAAQTVDEASIASTLKGQEAKLTESVDTFAKERAIAHQDRFYKGGTAASRYKASSEWWDNLPKSEKRAWRELVAPVKKYNDSLYRKAVISGVPAHLDDLMQLHHILPIEFSGSNSPRQMIGAIGRGLQGLGTEHAAQHSPAARKFYEFIQSRGGTESYYPATSIPSRSVDGRPFVTHGASAFQPLFPADLNPGGNPWAGVSNAPEHMPDLVDFITPGTPEYEWNQRVKAENQRVRTPSTTKPRGRLPGAWGALATLPIWAISSMLSSGEAEAGGIGETVKRNVSNPNWWFSGFTGLPEDFWSGVAESKERFSGSSYKEDFARAAEQRRQLWEGILNVPEQGRNLYRQVRSIFD